MQKKLGLCLYLMLASFLHGAVTPDYKLQKDDALRMTVYQEVDLATETQIGKSGSVSFPLIGNIKVIGLTIKEAEGQIKALYEKDYLVSAKVNLMVLAYAKKWVIVGGDVRRPGNVEYPEAGSLTLPGAIAQAGGLMETANPHGIVLRRKTGGTSTYSLRSSSGIILKHGDTITVSRMAISSSTITVSGQVQKPGMIQFPKQGGLDIVTAIAQAGGPNRIAYTKTVTVRRSGRSYTIPYSDILKGKVKTYSLRAGDVVFIKESKW